MPTKQLTGSTARWGEAQLEPLKQGDIAYFRLRNKIIGLELEPGDHVDELSLSKLLDMGRTPIREALQRLAQDNLVTIIPRKGTTIAPINLTELKEVSELRWELDTLSARWAAERADSASLQVLEEFVEEISRTEFTSRHHHVEADRYFHLQIARAAANRYLVGSIDQLFNHSVRLFNASGAEMASAGEELQDYRNILGALQAGDADAAVRAMQFHLQDARKRVASAYGMAFAPAN